jgi:chromosome segregation ATPase
MRRVFSETLTPMKHRAIELQREARALKDRQAKRARIAEAQEKLAQCASNARRLLERNSALAHALVRVDGALTTPKSFIARCTDQEKSLQKRLRATGGTKA